MYLDRPGVIYSLQTKYKHIMPNNRTSKKIAFPNSTDELGFWGDMAKKVKSTR
jgi:hypothetical protein